MHHPEQKCAHFRSGRRTAGHPTGALWDPRNRSIHLASSIVNINIINISVNIWGLWHQKQTSQARTSNCIPQNTVGCNHLSPPETPATGAKVLKYAEHSRYITVSSCQGNKERRPIVWGLMHEVTILNKILVSFLSSYVINNPSYPTAIYRKSLVQLIWLQYLVDQPEIFRTISM